MYQKSGGHSGFYQETNQFKATTEAKLPFFIRTQGRREECSNKTEFF